MHFFKKLSKTQLKSDSIHNYLILKKTKTPLEPISTNRGRGHKKWVGTIKDCYLSAHTPPFSPFMTSFELKKFAANMAAASTVSFKTASPLSNIMEGLFIYMYD